MPQALSPELARQLQLAPALTDRGCTGRTARRSKGGSLFSFPLHSALYYKWLSDLHERARAKMVQNAKHNPGVPLWTFVFSQDFACDMIEAWLQDLHAFAHVAL